MSGEATMTELMARVVLSKQELPAWLADGAGMYFANARLAMDGLDCGRVPRERLRRLQAQMRDGSYTRLRTLLAAKRGELSLEEHRAAWGLVFWLAHSGDRRRRQQHAAALTRFLLDVEREGGAGEFASYLELSVARLEHAWRKWIMALDSEHPYAGVGGKQVARKPAVVAAPPESEESPAARPGPGRNRITEHIRELPPVRKQEGG
jgi:hypothetical protein